VGDKSNKTLLHQQDKAAINKAIFLKTSRI